MSVIQAAHASAHPPLVAQSSDGMADMDNNKPRRQAAAIAAERTKEMAATNGDSSSEDSENSESDATIFKDGYSESDASVGADGSESILHVDDEQPTVCISLFIGTIQ